jgi:acyl-CoA reductase-like NAD-dependent aldehyde dehydrogenase
MDKFQYLRSLLEGSAVNAISCFSLTDSNYKEAVALLKDRFGNKQVIISKHMKSLMQLPVVTDNDDLKKLRLLYDKSESTVRSLNSIGISQESYGRFLAPTIMAKLTKELRITISRKLSDEWDLKSLLKYFVKNCSYRRNIICVL